MRVSRRRPRSAGKSKRLRRAKRFVRTQTRKLSEKEKNRIAAEANERFLRSGAEIKDVYGVLDE